MSAKSPLKSRFLVDRELLGDFLTHAPSAVAARRDSLAGLRRFPHPPLLAA